VSTIRRRPDGYRRSADRYRVAALVCVLATSACAFRALRQNIEHIERSAAIDGSVDADLPANGITVVVLLRSDTGDAVDSFALGPRGKYFFRVPAGTYFVAAFVDADRDFHYDPTRERGVWYGGPAPIRLAEGQMVGGVDVSVNNPGATVVDRPLVAPELGRRGLHDLPDVNIGTVTTIGDPRFSPENGKLGMWQPIDFASRGLAGVYFLEPHDPEKTAVLFVHGLTGYPAEFAYLVEHLDRKRFEPWLLYYPSGGDLDLLGAVMIRWLNSVGADYPVSHLVIVAHSMGGLVSRSAINQWMESVGAQRAVKLDAFITISTPWGGHAGAAMGVEHAPTEIPLVPSWYDLTPGSDFLKGLFKTTLPPECRYYLFFSYEGHSALVGGTNDGTVAVSSELMLEAQEQAVKMYGFPENHDSILLSKDVSERLNSILADVGR
jgi:pimeloyl-ACP methyl ester carboxylesterase